MSKSIQSQLFGIIWIELKRIEMRWWEKEKKKIWKKKQKKKRNTREAMKRKRSRNRRRRRREWRVSACSFALFFIGVHFACRQAKAFWANRSAERRIDSGRYIKSSFFKCYSDPRFVRPFWSGRGSATCLCFCWIVASFLFSLSLSLSYFLPSRSSPSYLTSSAFF